MNTKKILFVIVLYHCKLKDSRTYKTLMPPNEDLIVFDNSEEEQDISDYANGATYIHNKSNLGISYCYNQAADYGISHYYHWILLLDQDSDFSDVCINDYFSAIEETDCKLIAPMVKSGVYTISPTDISHHFSRLNKKEYSGVTEISRLSIINSGMCIALDAFKECGGYNEMVFLDYSDHEFIRRYKRYNSSVYVLNKSMYQEFSARVDDKESTIRRYRLFCLSIKGCERNGISDRFWFGFVVFKRAVSIMYRFRTFATIKILLRDYIL